MKDINTWLILLFLSFSITTVGQKKTSSKEPTQKQNTTKSTVPKVDIAADEKKVRDMVSFLEFMLNTLGNSSTPIRDKEVLITESYAKIFRDSNVQIEDDLDDERRVITNKNVAAYLKDVNFFFKQVRFEFTIEKIASSRTTTGQQFYKVTTTRNLKGTTSDLKEINSTQPRYIEINYNPKDQDLKIVSIYTNEFDEKRALTHWWKELSLEWKSVFQRKLNMRDSVELDDLKKITAITELDVSQNAFILNLDPLAQLTSLAVLNLSGTQVGDLTPIRNLTELVALDISSTQVIQLSALRYALKMEQLTLNNTQITDLSVLEKMPGLRHLELKNVPVSNFTPIEALNSLQVADFSHTQIKDLNPLTNLSQLRELNLSKTYVQNLTAIGQLKRLEILDLDSTQVQSLSPISGIENLRILSINHTPTSSLLPLMKLVYLEKVYCDQTLIKREDAEAFMLTKPKTLVVFDSKDLKAWWDQLPIEWKKTFTSTARIHEMPNKDELAKAVLLDSINISGKVGINDLEPLTKLPRIRILIANNTSISDLSPLKGYSDIDRLDISHTEVRDLSVINTLNRIKVLQANNCKIEHIKNLKASSLTMLYVDNTTINDLEASGFLHRNPNCVIIYKTDQLMHWWSNLSELWKAVFIEVMKNSNRPSAETLHQLTQLENLQLLDVPITNLHPLGEFVRLKELHFSGTNMSSISPIKAITSLRSLHATNSPIANLDSLGLISELEDLDISNTPVEDIYPIWKLKELKKLNCSGTQIKRLDALQKLEKLEFLDCSNTQVSKLNSLDYLPLKTFKGYNTKISNRSIENFKASHPECRVIYYR
jgi:hypothetical protein